MLPDEMELQNVKLEVGLLKKDIEQTDRLCDKLSESIEKIQEVNVNIMRMITLHEQRHEQHEKAEQDLKEDIKELHSRITTVSREMNDRMDQLERHISERIDLLRSDLAKHEKNDPNRLSNTLKEIDKYKWMIVGGAIALGWVIEHVDLDMLGKLLK
jgi:chromosome segregation ATPase